MHDADVRAVLRCERRPEPHLAREPRVVAPFEPAFARRRDLHRTSHRTCRREAYRQRDGSARPASRWPISILFEERASDPGAPALGVAAAAPMAAFRVLVRMLTRAVRQTEVAAEFVRRQAVTSIVLAFRLAHNHAFPHSLRESCACLRMSAQCDAAYGAAQTQPVRCDPRPGAGSLLVDDLLPRRHPPFFRPRGL